MKKTKVVVPISGGMDSTVILYRAVEQFGADNIFGLSYDYGQRHKRELNLAEYHVNKLKINEWQTIDTSFIKKLAPTSSLTNNDIETPDIRQIAGEAQPKSYVPNRNMIFLSIAASYAEAVGAKIVYHGATKVDSLAGYWDASPEFIPTINDILAVLIVTGKQIGRAHV